MELELGASTAVLHFDDEEYTKRNWTLQIAFWKAEIALEPGETKSGIITLPQRTPEAKNENLWITDYNIK